MHISLSVPVYMRKIVCIYFCLFSAFHVSGQKNFNLGLLAQVKHPVETNDIWGYVDKDGIEYAVVGTEIDCRIYSLANPSSPRLVSIVPGATSIWRDYKSYDEYIYQITQRGEDGLRIIDMTNAPEEVSSTLYKEVLTVGNETDALKTCHNLWIDTKEGVAYLSGCNLGNGGVIMLDIATDPKNPIYLGAVDERYSHDVITKGDTLFSSEINEGRLGIYDISDKSQPKLISRTQTSSFFTHNAWYSDDGNYVFTTDERPNAYVDAYDIRDLEAPVRIDQYQPVIDGNVIPHNTHYYNGFLVTSWYTEGVLIIDAHRPDNLIKVGQYDTYTQNASGFQGAWGAYPYLPSGKILVSDFTGGLFVLQPEYRRAAYLEGNVIDAISGAPINAAFVSLSDQENTVELSKADGVYKTGTAQGGTYEVLIEHPDYIAESVNVTLTPGEVTQLDVRLFRIGSVIGIAGSVVDQEGSPIPNAKLVLTARFREEEATTDVNGNYQAVVPRGSYDVFAAAWGYKGTLITREISEGLVEPIILEKGYEDDFFVDLGWKVRGDAKRGIWERVIPKATFYQGKLSNPAGDIDTDIGEFCYLTGNMDSSVGKDDVDDGTTILTSPPINISEMRNPQIEITPWFFNGGGDSPLNDTLRIYLSDGIEKMLVQNYFKDILSGGRWRPPLVIPVHAYFRRAKEVYLEIHASDQPDSGHLVEAGIDQFRMYEGPLPNYPEVQEEINVVLAPNPADHTIYIDAETNKSLVLYRIFDSAGRVIATRRNPESEITVTEFAKGFYFAQFLFDNGVTTVVPFEKL